MNIRDVDEQGRQCLRAWRNTDLRLPDCVHCVAAPIGERNNLGVRIQGRSDKRAKVGGVERMPSRSENLAAGGGDRFGCQLFQRPPEGIVDSNEKPRI